MGKRAPRGVNRKSWEAFLIPLGRSSSLSPAAGPYRLSVSISRAARRVPRLLSGSGAI